MDEDTELKLITQRKLAQLKRRAATATATAAANAQKVVKTDRELVEEILVDRGDEVLKVAYSYYQKETAQIVTELARLIRAGKFKERISGGELYSLFRSLGLRFKLNTSMKVEEKGRLIDIGEKFRVSKEAKS
jgi:DNA-binding TFAR19-related protein (PDSD5 family)